MVEQIDPNNLEAKEAFLKDVFTAPTPYVPPQTWQEMFLAHKECNICVPFFQVIDIFYKDHSLDDELYVEAQNLNLYIFANTMINKKFIEQFDYSSLIKSQFNHLAWLHQ